MPQTKHQAMELLAARRTPLIDYRGVPAIYRPKRLPDGHVLPQISAVCRSEADCQSLTQWFGDGDFCPFAPVLLLVPGMTPTLICGFGYASAAELRDVAVVTWNRRLQALAANKGAPLNFEARREKAGLMRREELDAATRDAFRRRAAQHRANPRTDPPRAVQHMGRKQLFSAPDDQSWKEERKT